MQGFGAGGVALPGGAARPARRCREARAGGWTRTAGQGWDAHAGPPEGRPRAPHRGTRARAARPTRHGT